MEEFEKNDGIEKDEIFSKTVRAGKRTYFFDVKSTKKNDFYLTITERKRIYERDGSFQIEKHKIFKKFLRIASRAIGALRTESHCIFLCWVRSWIIL